MVLTRPTKKRTATAPVLTTLYCIHVLLTAILRLKLVAVEKMPMKRSNGLRDGSGADFSASKSTTCSEFSDVGKPLATKEIRLMSSEILTSLTSHGSKLWKNHKSSRHKASKRQRLKQRNREIRLLLHVEQKMLYAFHRLSFEILLLLP